MAQLLLYLIMFFKSSIVSEITDYVEKMPKERQIKLLDELKKETQKKVSAKKINKDKVLKEIEALTKKSIWENHTKPKLDALNIRY